ncbi:MAG TPA: hypothetical protein V6D09_22785 [Leptolyngbyaceae cyanobacterium]
MSAALGSSRLVDALIVTLTVHSAEDKRSPVPLLHQLENYLKQTIRVSR